MEKFICPKCNGRKYFYEHIPEPILSVIYSVVKCRQYSMEKTICSVCGGDGELDWIEMARGQKGSDVKNKIYRSVVYRHYRYYLFTRHDWFITTPVIRSIHRLRSLRLDFKTYRERKMIARCIEKCEKEIRKGK